jgi:transcriptional regulator with XRE-family HTH domain
MQLAELTQLRADLDAATKSPGDDALFHTLIDRSMRLLMLTDADLAKEVGTNRTSINRWKNGKNAPHPAVRPRVYALLAKRVRTLLTREEREERAARSSATPPTLSLPVHAATR